MNKTGRIILFPCPIVEGRTESLSLESITMLHKTTCFIVERAKTARHFIKATKHPIPISELKVYEINDDKQALESFLDQIMTGVDIGVISEAGCPGIADPGAEIVAWAHEHKVKVIPLIGPSSIFLALMASGMSGQNFAFNGYLSNKKPELLLQLKALENKVLKTGQTQIFMEAPYRNAFLLEACASALQESTRLCLACDINGVDEEIIQQKIRLWKNCDYTKFHKRPCIYLIGK